MSAAPSSSRPRDPISFGRARNFLLLLLPSLSRLARGVTNPRVPCIYPLLFRELRENGNPLADSFLGAARRRAEMTHYFRTPAVKQEVNAAPRLLPYTVLFSLRDTTRRSYRGRLFAPRETALVCRNCGKSSETLRMHPKCRRFSLGTGYETLRCIAE